MPRLRQNNASTASTPRAKDIPVKHKRDMSNSQMLLPQINDQDNALPRGRCSYVTNHKAYLKQKGYTVSNVYSLKRHRDQNLMFTRTSGLVNSESDLTLLRSKLSKERGPHSKPAMFNKQPDVWRPQESRRMVALNLREYLQALDREARVLGHSQSHSSRRLGRVLTRTHLHQLLSQEDPVILPHVDSPLSKMFPDISRSTD